MAEPEATGGQASSGDSTGTTPEAPVESGGQSAETSQTTGAGPDLEAAETFFDPKEIEGKPELQAAYKQMQGNFTKKMQGIREGREKIDAYDQFMRDPVGAMKMLGQQYGYDIMERGANAAADPKQYNSIDELKADLRQEIIQEMGPVFNEVKSLKQQNIESYLDSNHPKWRQYEDEMIDNLKKHPTLATDPSTLYRLSVPEKEVQQEAMKNALARVKSDTEGASTSGATTSRQTSEKPSGPLSFDQAVAYAKQQLKKQGIGPG